MIFSYSLRAVGKQEEVITVVMERMISKWSSSFPKVKITEKKYLKEQYPFTAHAPNFDFWTGCPEIKRCEESKRTLKNPFASRLAEFDTTLKLLRITDQWYIVPV